jgi:hypothetical protein
MHIYYSRCKALKLIGTRRPGVMTVVSAKAANGVVQTGENVQ